MKKFNITIATCLCLLAFIIQASPQSKKNHIYPWSVLIYKGQTVKQNLHQIIFKLQTTYIHETICSIELSRIFFQNNYINFQLSGNIANRAANSKYYNNTYPILEEDVYFKIYLLAFPWNKWLKTTVGIGEGLSYANEIPFSEKYEYNNKNSKKLLDFMTFEITLGLSAYPQWQIVGRIHHRSSAFGTFSPKHSHAGSNAIGLAIRYFFGK